MIRGESEENVAREPNLAPSPPNGSRNGRAIDSDIIANHLGERAGAECYVVSRKSF
jgi:hypothetical protein